MLPEKALLTGLSESAKAFLAKEELKNKDILLIVEGIDEDKLFQNLSYFCPTPPLEMPAWETLPGEKIAPSPDIVGKRMETLETLLRKKAPSIVLCSIHSLLQKIPSKEELSPFFLLLRKNGSFPFEGLVEKLNLLGYKRTPTVTDKGEFAVRGGIIDIFPPCSIDPFRIDFFSEKIEEIRIFDPVGQKTIASAKELLVCPADERSLLQNASKLTSLLDFLEDPLIFWNDLLQSEDAYAKIQSIPAARSPYFFSLEKLWPKLLSFSHAYCSEFSLEESFEMFGQKFQAKHFSPPFFSIEEPLSIDPDLHYNFLCNNESEEKEVKRLLNLGDAPNISWKRGYITKGFGFQKEVFIPSGEITGRKQIRRQKWRGVVHTSAAQFHSLTPGDSVVHLHSGIGKYLGVEKQKDHEGNEREFLLLEYAGGSKLFVPLSQSHLVSRYIGVDEKLPTLSELGNKRWQKTLVKAQNQIVGFANELLELYAKRTLDKGFCYSEDSSFMQEFEKDFPYLLTSDQKEAIERVKKDMCSTKPMDRLILGDVGYGKTEVAMRASFKAVVDGKKQVAVLVPTTVLAMQHFETFSERMDSFGVKIAVLSRFQTAKENKETIENLLLGAVDILIGTHRILSKDIVFHDLGLMIIDEEQRFGVRAKEHLKKRKQNIDCLTLSATPIPRTLHMSLVHARDMSLINTPPQDRLPIKTIVLETDFSLIQNALLREFARGGQAFFIHNRVETIASRAEQIKNLIPSARVGIVHGQMDPEDIDTVFHKFKENQLDLLFATTIVESGVDVPNANTILIDRADTYGLADLYQMRGRVGRWNRSAYAYFLIPKNVRLKEIAQKRLHALAEASGFGGGMKIAMRDLEIRGAGELLGTQQSGQVSSIGFHLYCRLLKKAISALKKEEMISLQETKIEAGFPAFLPKEYIGEVSLRMEIYYRLGDANSKKEIDALFSELIDRFGSPAQPVLWLFALARIKLWASLNHFILLKFQSLSLYAEQKEKALIQKKTLLLPKAKQEAQGIEAFVIAELEKHFSCPRKAV